MTSIPELNEVELFNNFLWAADSFLHCVDWKEVTNPNATLDVTIYDYVAMKTVSYDDLIAEARRVTDKPEADDVLIYPHVEDGATYVTVLHIKRRDNKVQPFIPF